MEIVVGAAVSLLIQWVKNGLKLGEYATLGAVLLFSLVAAFLYAYLQSSGMWEHVLPVLGYAGAFYTYIIARFEK